MKQLHFALPKNERATYRKIADGLRLAIRNGQLTPGENLPSSREIAKQLGVHRHTVMNALGELKAEGWIEAFEKKYYRVTSTLPSLFLRPMRLETKSPLTQKFTPTFARTVDIPDYQPQARYKHSFPSGLPDLRLFPMREFKSHLHDALRAKDILTYGHPAGHDRLIRQIATYLRRIRGVQDREILVTHGSQEAIFLLSQLLVKPGDTVAVENLGYPPALEALKFAGAKLFPIRVDGEGLVVEDLAKAMKKRKIKLLYLTPLHQYPTTVTLSATRRLELYELARKNDLLILEDDYDHEFHYSGQPVTPLASFDPGGNVLYVSTFSKILFPSARIGFMAVPKGIAAQAARLKRISSRQNEHILQDAIARWMEDGGFERHLRKMRRVYQERCEGMISDLEKLKEIYPNLSWNDPCGGMALWIDIGADAFRFADKAKKAGVLVNPEGLYRMDGASGTHLRLGFSGQTVEENSAALKALFPT